MTENFRPETIEQTLEAVAWALSEQKTLEVVGRGGKRAFGRPVGAKRCLDLSALSGIILYEPNELVMSTAAATPMADIESALAEHRQQLAFEPPDLGPLLGGMPGNGTIGGAISCNLGGPRRLKAGAARDHVLGFHAVSGRGKIFKSGGRVVKNVTGFDLSKLMAGSFGTLGVMTQVTFKVLPAAQEVRTMLVLGASDTDAVRAMTAAMHSPYEVSGAAHLTATVAAVSSVGQVCAAGDGVTAVRVEGPGPSVEYRCRALRGLLAKYGDCGELDTGDSIALWREVRDVAYFAGDQVSQVWRLSVPPAAGAKVAGEVTRATDGRLFFDWGGGLLWLAHDPRPDANHEIVRGVLKECGGHATLVRAAADVRAAVPVFQPQQTALAALGGRIKDAFDPRRVLNPGRMAAGQ